MCLSMASLNIKNSDPKIWGFQNTHILHKLNQKFCPSVKLQIWQNVIFLLIFRKLY